jgi:hypothetical protein
MSLFFLATAFIFRLVFASKDIPQQQGAGWVGLAYTADLIRGPLNGRDMFGMVFPVALLARSRYVLAVQYTLDIPSPL